MFNFARKYRLYQDLKRTIPVKIGSQIRNFFLDSFRKQGFTDDSFQAWKEVKRRIPGTKEYKYPKTKGLGRRTSAINVRTGRLRKSIVVKEASFGRIVVGTTGVSYASYVNDKRPFIEKSATLNKKVKATFKKEMDKILKGK